MSHRVDGAHRWNAVWRPGEPPSARRAWCYQTVGVAAALYDRARLDGDDALRALAADAVAAVLDARYDGEQSWDAALCHGRSGVAAVAWHFADDERLVRHAARSRGRCSPSTTRALPLGYRTYNLRDRRHEDRADFLDAALGIAQFLIDAATAPRTPLAAAVRALARLNPTPPARSIMPTEFRFDDLDLREDPPPIAPRPPSTTPALPRRRPTATSRPPTMPARASAASSAHA